MLKSLLQPLHLELHALMNDLSVQSPTQLVPGHEVSVNADHHDRQPRLGPRPHQLVKSGPVQTEVVGPKEAHRAETGSSRLYCTVCAELCRRCEVGLVFGEVTGFQQVLVPIEPVVRRLPTAKELKITKARSQNCVSQKGCPTP